MASFLPHRSWTTSKSLNIRSHYSANFQTNLFASNFNFPTGNSESPHKTRWKKNDLFEFAARRATEIAYKDAGSEEECRVGMEHVTRAHEEMFCSPRIAAIRCGRLVVNRVIFLRNLGYLS